MGFSVCYEVLRPVDEHPCGPRHRFSTAENWLAACDEVRKVYGEEKADRIRIDAVFTRDESHNRVFQFNRFGWSP